VLREGLKSISPSYPYHLYDSSEVQQEAALSAQDSTSGSGRRRLPRSRRLVTDLLYFSKKLPSQPVARDIRIPELAMLRKSGDPNQRISWSALFLKAYALLSVRQPLLRQCYFPYPWQHIYQHDCSIGRITVARQHKGEEWVFFAQIPAAEHESLLALQKQLDHFKTAPIQSIERFRLQDIFSRVPLLLRRLAWWVTLNVSARTRVNRLGTFAMTTISGRGAFSIHPPLIAGNTLTFGPIDSEGNVRITIVYDHRLMDGGTVAQFLQELESLLNGEVLEELRALRENNSHPA
jgi:hypothetical protein